MYCSIFRKQNLHLSYFAVIVILIALSMCSLRHCIAEESKAVRIKQVLIEGTSRVDKQSLLLMLQSKPGNLSFKIINEDIRALYATGFFERVEALLRDSTGAQNLVFRVIENPVLRKIFVVGNEEVSESDLAGVLEIDEKRFVNSYKIQEMIKQAKAYYESKGFYDADFSSSVSPVGDNEVDITFRVEERKRYAIDKVTFTGLEKVDADDLRDSIQTRRYKWWNSWFYGTGRVSNDVLKNDQLILKQYFLDHGYIEARVSEAEVDVIDDKVVVNFSIQEGPQYKIGKISISGDPLELESEEEVLEGIESKVGGIFSASRIREDSFLISDKYSDIGYAFVNVVPDTNIDSKALLVDIDFAISQGKKVKVRKINIFGNNKTYDNVIRREFRVQEQETFSGKDLKRTRTMLERLGYFEEINLSTEPTDRDDEVDINLNVREANTGSFSIGAGYSTSDGGLFNIRLTERNFWGTGKKIDFNADIGTIRNTLILSYQDRRFLDSHWSLGVDALNTERVFSDFDRNLTGGGFSFGYPLEEFFDSEWSQDIVFSIKYEYLDVTIDDVDPDDAAPLVLESEGSSRASGITPRLVRNTLNDPINPTKGSRQTFAAEITGLGGNEEYFLFTLRNVLYTPLAYTNYGDLTFSWRTSFGYGETFDDDPFPLFRRFFPGGINTVRGYEARTLGPKDEDGNEFGGSKQFINNFELIFPLFASAGIRGLIFYDFGEAFDDDDSIDLSELRHAYGLGLRWSSPLGPIRIEFGFPIDREEGEDSFITLFSFGAAI